MSQKADAMAALLANSVRRKIAVGSYTGRGIVRVGDQIDEDSMDAFESPRCYCARPAVATERLSEQPDGRLLYRLKRPWRNGTSPAVIDRRYSYTDCQ